MKRKILSIFIVLVLVFSLLPISAMASYSDVEDHWAKAAIDKWSDLGILEGSDGNFRPEYPITRGDMAVIIDRIMQFTTAADNTFTDLGEEYYTDAVLKCNEAGIITGDSGLVRPTDNITREEAVVMLGRALGLTESGASSGFDDSASISSWALGYVNAMAAKGYVHGTNDLFNPKSSIKRGEIVTILDNAITKIYNEAAEYTGDVEGIAIVNTTGVTLSDMTIKGDLIIAEGVGDGDVTLNNVTVTGNTIVRGGGANSIHINGDSSLANLIIEKTDDGQIRIITEDGSVVDAVFVNDGNDDIILTGTFGSVTIAAGVTVKAVGATVELVDITDDDGQFIIDKDSVIDTLILDAAATVTNNGKITKAEVNVEGTTIDGNEPEEILYAEGVAGAKDTDTTGGGGGGGGGYVTPSISVANLVTSDASTVSFNSSVADATIIWNGTTLTTKTTSGTNTITVPLMESGTNNTLKITKSGYVAYSGTVTWAEPYDTDATLSNWVQDRTNPLEWAIDGDNWITMTNNINPSNTWYGWNGKSADTNMGLTTDWIVETQFEITSNMLAKDDVKASIWLAVDGIENFRADSWGGTIDWTILQFRKNSTTGTTTWQWWDSYYENDPNDPTDVGAWLDIAAPIPTDAGVYDITITCSNGLIKQYINGIFVNQYDIVGVTDDLTAPTDVFIQSYSFGEEYTIKAKVPTVRYLYMYPTDAVHNNEVSGQITNDSNGVVDGYLSYVGTNDLHIEGSMTPVDNFHVNFTGTVSGAFSGDITAQMQINGIDTMFGEITGTSASPKSVWIRGVFPKSGIEGDFEGEIIVGDDPTCVTSMAVTSPADTIVIGETLQMTADINPSDQDVLWSVWSAGDSDKIATIDEGTGLLTAVGPGTVTVIAKALDGSLIDASKSITVVTSTLDAEITSADSYVYDPAYAKVGTIVFDNDTNTYTGTYTPEQFLAGGAMNDMARYLGALSRQDSSTIISIKYSGADYTWNTEGTLKGSNWEDSTGQTLVNTIVSDMQGSGIYSATVTVTDGVSTKTVTFSCVVLNTLDAEITSADSYVYDPAYAKVGTIVFDDATNTFTATYTSEQFAAGDAMNDMARYLGALYRQNSSTIISIDYNGTNYTWNTAGSLKGSNWENSSSQTLVNAIVTDLQGDPYADVIVTVSDGVNTETVTFKSEISE